MSAMNPYAPRFVAPAPDPLTAAAPTPLVRAAGAVTALAAVLTVITAIQTVTSLEFYVPSWLEAFPYAQFAFAGTLLPLGYMLARARAWAAVIATIVAPIAALVTAAWTILSITGGYLAVMTLFATAASIAAAVLAPLAIKPSKTATAARAAGMDLGF
jgi:hypothetical protein